MPLEITSQTINVNCYCGTGVGGAVPANKVYSGSVTAISATETDIINTTLSADFTLTDIFFVGECDGVYRLYRNSLLVAELRSSASERVIHHAFSSGYSYSAGDTLRVTVEHYEPGSKEFKAFAVGSE